MLIELTDEERDMLLSLVQREVVELRQEIRHTDTASYREDLRDRRRALQALLGHLEGSAVS